MTKDKIDISEIRKVTQDNGKEATFKVTEKISSFFQDVLTFQPSEKNEKNEKLLQTDVTFIQIKEILKLIDPSLVEKIPEKLRNFISNYTSFINYTFEYDIERTLDNQFIYEDTKSLIAYFDYTYWSTEEDKKLIELAWLDKDRENEYDFSSKENHVTYSEDVVDNTSTETVNSYVQSTSSTDNSKAEPVLTNTVPVSNSENIETISTTDESQDIQENSLMVKKDNIFIRIINKIKSFFYKRHSKVEEI